MHVRTALLGAAVFAACLGVQSARATILYGLLSDFQDGTAQGWREGSSSFNPPTNQPSGGPLGAGDRYLRNISSGSGAGGKNVTFNTTTWTGDYLSAGINRLQLDVKNFGSASVPLRAGLRRTNSERYITEAAVVIPGDGQWHSIAIDITENKMVPYGGVATYEEVMSDVRDLRIMIAENATWQGTPINTTMGYDNILALPEPTSVAMILAGALMLATGRGRRTVR